MGLFHNHTFLQSDVPEKLYCPCGAVRDLHRHTWGRTGETITTKNMVTGTTRVISYTLKCSSCGEEKQVLYSDEP